MMQLVMVIVVGAVSAFVELAFELLGRRCPEDSVRPLGPYLQT